MSRDVRFASVRSEGGLLPPDLLNRIVDGDRDTPMLGPETYGLARSERPGEAASRVWTRVKTYWDAFKSATETLAPGESGVTETREQWLLPLFRELGYGRLIYVPAAETVGDRRYRISHRAGEYPGAPPIHTVGLRMELDRSAGLTDEDGRRISPHALLQEYLNGTEHLWGIVTNGLRLRLLRDNYSLVRSPFLEFDLEAMLEGGAYADFVLLYLMAHRSRLPQPEAKPESCPLERWRDSAQRQGTRALDGLRTGVESAIRVLGQGLLEHPENGTLRGKLASGELPVTDYYRQLLRLVYRLLFLLVAEERDLLFAERAAPRTRAVYTRCYSVARLRELAERRWDPEDRHDDLWRSLLVTFGLLRGESGRLDLTALDLPTLGVGLFDGASCPDLDAALLGNTALLAAMRGLSQVRQGTLVLRVNYRDMDAEELGSVYESLLDYHPLLHQEGGRTHFDLVTGSERRTTGSYYTPRALVAELIKSALEPVIAAALAEARSREEKRVALLRIRVCDPASGSGHFLLAAARRIGRALAQVETGDLEPDPAALRVGTRDAIRHCIYGVDLNPLAVDLCKLALWIEGQTPGKPLSFLDHRIRCGNSLIGATPAILEAGIPDAAFTPVTGEDKKLSSALKKRNKLEHKQSDQLTLFGDAQRVTADEDEVREAMLIDGLPDDSTADTGAKRTRHEALTARLDRKRLVADVWASAFFWALREGEPQPPTQLALQSLRRGGNPLNMTQLARIAELVEQNRIFHWHLEFPEVFGEDGQGGFDCVLGNPPWEQIQLDAREYFQTRFPDIANAQHMADRDKAITQLATSHPAMYAEFAKMTSVFEKTQLYFHNSGRFPLTSYGRLNSAPLFAELSLSVISGNGRTGIIVPAGIATDSFNQYFFAALVERQAIYSLFGFENEEFIFQDVHNAFKFCLLTLVGNNTRIVQPTLCFFCRRVSHVNGDLRRFSLNSSDILLLNPNTQTCPVFRTRTDAELTRAIYCRTPVLVNESDTVAGDPWGFRGLLMFMMNTASVFFRTRQQLQSEGWILDGNIFYRNGDRYLPLYEAKMIWHYDHRFASYVGKENSTGRPSRKYEGWYGVYPTDPGEYALPQYWVPASEVESRLAGRWSAGWLIGFRDITSAVVERTAIFSLLPRVGVGNNAPLCLLRPEIQPRHMAALLGNFSCLVFDYVARQKVGGTHMNFFIVNQLPVLPPGHYNHCDLDFILPRVLELVYTAWDLQPFARDLDYDGPPFTWDDDRRALLRAELDAYYARLYGLTRKQLRYILDPHSLTDRELTDILDPLEDPPAAQRTKDFPGETFRVLKNREMKDYGEYRTGRLVLEAWDRLATAASGV